MSDDDEITYVKKQKTIHYGSLEDQERARLTAVAVAENDDDQKVGGNINVSNGNVPIFGGPELIIMDIL